MKALTVKQPWAHLIVKGIKPIENRSWKTTHRGPLLIHAGKAWSDHDVQLIEQQHGIIVRRDDVRFGAVIGVVELVDIVDASLSPWFVGPYGWVLRNPRRFKKPIPMNGRLSLFDVYLKQEQAT